MWKLLLLCTFGISLFTGCVTARYTDPNLIITPEFKEMSDKGKTLQIVIEDSLGTNLMITTGLADEYRKQNDSLTQFYNKMDKYFDWKMKDISTLKRIKFYNPEDTVSYDYTLYLNYITIIPNIVQKSSSHTNSFGETITIPLPEYYVAGLHYDVTYRITDNKTNEVVLRSKVIANTSSRGSTKKYSKTVTSKDWKHVIRNMAATITRNTPFYSREKEKKSENKFYDFNKKTQFQTGDQPSLLDILFNK